MKLNILVPLTKDYILDRITQEEIMEFYTGIEVSPATLIGNSFTSPFRIDNSPTCNYFYKTSKNGETRLKLKDWNGSFYGDIFDVASKVTKIRTNSAQGFRLLLNKIACDFKLHAYRGNSKEVAKLDNIVTKYINQSELRVFKVIPRAWNDFDKRYWYDKFYCNKQKLKEGMVIPVQELEIEDREGYLKKVYKYFAKDPAYAYYGGKINGITIWKIYFPFRGVTSGKFMTNYSFIQGVQMFKPARVGIITKSLKDVLVLSLFGIPAVAVPSETYLMSEDEVFYLKSRCDIILTNFDYDPAGIRLAIKYRKVHGLLPLMFTRGKYNQKDYGVKDISEFLETYGLEATISLIQNLYKDHQEDLDTITLYNYNSLKWIA